MLSRGSEDLKYMVEVNDLQAVIVNATTSDNYLIALLPNYTPYNVSCISFNITLSPSNSAGRGQSSSISLIRAGIVVKSGM